MRKQRKHQQGISLYIVIVLVLLSMLLALWASRTSLFNEMVVSNDADYQRAFEAAQALLQDAELDIRSADYDVATNKTIDNLDCSAGGDVCRSSTADRFPLEAKEITALINILDAQPTNCRNGLCTRRTGRQDFWNYTKNTNPPPENIQADAGEVPLEDLTKEGIGARFGQYTGAKLGDASKPANPILADRSADNKGGWYWIEVLPYTKSKAGQPTPPCNAPPSAGVPNAPGGPTLIVGDKSDSTLRPNLDPAIIYRITALAYGRKVDAEGNPVTMAVIQSSYARSRCAD